MSYLIVGTPRSGTGYTAKMLQSSGIMVGHECCLDDGISSWLCTFDSESSPYGPTRSSVFKYYGSVTQYHQVRFPFATISSLHTEVNGRNFVNKILDVGDYCNDPVSSMKFWLLWNEQGEKTSSKSYCLERAHDFWHVPPYENSEYNTRRKKHVDLNALREADRPLFDDCLDFYWDIYKRHEFR